MQLSDDCFAFGGALMTTSEALDLLSARMVPVTEPETVPLPEATGRILSADVISERDVPPHPNSAVDGYAVAFADLATDAPTRLRVAGRAAAGHPVDGPRTGRTAIRVFTGAVLPDGCDTVAMQEDCALDGADVVLPAGLHAGANSREVGEDVRRGDRVLARGHRLRPQDVGLLAALGKTYVPVHSRLRVAVFSTGDELREPGDTLPPGTVYDSNRYVIRALLGALPIVVDDLGILPDRADVIADALARAATGADALLTSGGVSVGEEDHVKWAVERNGRLHFWRLAIKPGRPLALGQIGTTPFVGLPGNPVAAMVTFVRFARPLLLRLGGAADVEPSLYRVRAGFAHRKKPQRREWVRARISPAGDGVPEAHKFTRQGAGILRSLVDSDGLVELPEDMTELRPGTMVDFLPFSEVLG
jgi:molybdopterin molybdotransferase